MSGEKFQIDMCHGPLLGKIILFSLPLIFTQVFQLLFNAVDLMVVGRFVSSDAMASVGATMTLNSFMINAFSGLSVASNILVSRFYGGGDRKSLSLTVRTSMQLALYGGIAVMVIALLAARPLLILMQTPGSILDMSCLYVWICFCAIPCVMLYNFGAAILRAVGDTRRPLIFLIVAGVVNVGLNLFFILVCGMGVAGVAIATAISHGVSAWLILRTLVNTPGCFRLKLRGKGFAFPIFREMLWLGIPAMIQSACFPISNMIIQSAVNSFGAVAIAGNTAAQALEGFIYIGSYAFHHTAVSFVSQNYGGGKYKRIVRSLLYSYLSGTVFCITIGMAFLWWGRTLLAFFNPDPEAIEWGMLRLKVIGICYFLCSSMDAASGGLRGLGYSTLSTVNSLTGACAMRILWIWWIFPVFPTYFCVLVSYPISWFLVTTVSSGCLWFLCRRLLRTGAARRQVWTAVSGSRA